MDNLSFIKELLELKRQRALDNGGASDFSVKGKKGDSIKSASIKNGELILVIKRDKKEETINLGSVIGPKGKDADEAKIAARLADFIRQEIEKLKADIPDFELLEAGIRADLEADLPDIVADALQPAISTIEQGRESLEDLNADIDQKVMTAIATVEKSIKKAKEEFEKAQPKRGVFFGGPTSRAVYQLSDVTLTSLADNDVLSWDATLGRWVNAAAASGGISDGDKGDITVSGSGTTWTIDDEAVTFAKMQHIATNRILGRSTAGTGDIEALADGDARAIMGLATTDSPQFASIELGHATDTTISRVSAGVIAVEGTNVQLEPVEGGFVDGDKTKLDGIETGADVTDTTNVTAAGALMDSELTSEASVKAIDQGLATTDTPTFSQLGINTTDLSALTGTIFGGAAQDERLFIDGSATNKVPSIVIGENQGGAIQFVDSSRVASADFGIFLNDLYFVNRKGGKTYFYHTASLITATITDGKLGIGTTTPGEVLDVVGNAEINGNIIVTGTVDGRDVAADGTKLDGIEASADVTDAANVSSSGGIIYVNHGATAGTSRPSVSGIVYWIGSVEPTNANNGDVWVDTA